jgi:hypothetical protein
VSQAEYFGLIITSSASLTWTAVGVILLILIWSDLSSLF